MYACSKYKGLPWKFLGMYGLFITLNAIYDVGMYARWFIYGPSYLRKLAELDPNESFSPL